MNISRYISLIIAVLFPILSYGQADFGDFDPPNPGNPTGSDIDNLIDTPTPVIRFFDKKIVIDCEDEDVQIYYTTNGNDPVAGQDNFYVLPFLPQLDCMIKAIAYRDGGKSSEIASFEYKRSDWSASPPIFHRDGNYLSITSDTPNAQIYYTTNIDNGGFEGSYNIPGWATLYTEPIKLNGNCGIKALAVTDSLLASESRVFIIDDFVVRSVEISFAKRKINLSCETVGAVIRYTTDGSWPTDSTGIVYTEPFLPDTDCLISAAAFLKGYHTTHIATQEYKREDWVAPQPIFKREGNQLWISSGIEKAQIFYMEGDENPLDTEYEPKEGAILYVSPITLRKNGIFTAVAMNEDLFPSNPISFEVDNFVMEDLEIKFSNRKIHIAGQSEDALIRYTIDGYDPTEEYGNIYSEPFLPAYDCTIKAVAFREGYNKSAVSTFTYRRQDWMTHQPVFSRSGNQLSITTASPDAIIYYTDDGSELNFDEDCMPTAQVKVYDGPITLTKNTRYATAAVSEELLPSQSSVYVVNDFVVSGVKIEFSQKQIKMTCDTDGASIRYTTDGTEPTATTGILYSAGFLPEENCVITAMGFKDDYQSNIVTSLQYNKENFTVPGLLVTPLYQEEAVMITPNTNNQSEKILGDGETILVNGRILFSPGERFGDKKLPVETLGDEVVAEWKSENRLEREPVRLPLEKCVISKTEFDGKDIFVHTEKATRVFFVLDGTSDNTMECLVDEAEGFAKFEPNVTGRWECYACGDKAFRSNIVAKDVHALRMQDNTVMLNESGWLSQAIGLEQMSSWDRLTVIGPSGPAAIGTKDMETISGMKHLLTMNLTDTKPVKETTADFSGLEKLMSISLPGSNVDSCEWNLEKLELLSAIRWNSPTSMSEELFSSLRNRHTLVYVDDKSLAPLNAKNVVCNGIAEELTLTHEYPFCVIDEFVADKAVYTKRFYKKTEIDNSIGWETLVLPFDVDIVMQQGEKEREIKPFMQIAPEDNLTPGFWLASTGNNGSQGSWVDSPIIEAGIPYIIAMPNSDAYIEEFNIRGDVAFIGHEVKVSDNLHIADFVDANSKDRHFSGSYVPIKASNNIFSLAEDGNGSLFVERGGDVCPFECWFDGDAGMRRIAIGGTSNVVKHIEGNESVVKIWQEGRNVMILSSSDMPTGISDLAGTMVRRLNLHAGDIAVVEGLTPGVYIVANRKVLVK